MSLIYNSLKQHEKRTNSQSQTNAISQKAEQNKVPAKVVWLALIGVGIAILISLVSLQSYWHFQAKDEYVNSVNHLVLVSQDNAVSDLSVANTVMPKEVELERDDLVFAQKDKDISLLQTNIENENTTKKMVIVDQPPEIIVDKRKAIAPIKIVTVEVENKVEKPIVKPVEKVIVINDVATKKVAPEKQVEQKEISASASTEPFNQKIQTVQLAKLEKPREVSLAVVPDTKPEVINSSTKPITIALKQSRKPMDNIVKVVADKRIKIVEENKVSRQPIRIAKVEQSKIEKNSIDYFIAVKRKVSEIKQSVNFKNFKAAHMGLNQLETLSGSESVIFQRMNAYTALKGKRYQEAATSYQKLLNQQPDDLEANMNLVIVLSEMGEKQSAKRQLSRLDNLYPESSRVKQYKKQIQAKYGY